MEERFSAPVQTGSRAHPAPASTMGTGSFLEVNRPGRGVDHPPTLSAEVKERVELYLYSPLWAFVACSRIILTITFTRLVDLPIIIGLSTKFHSMWLVTAFLLAIFTTLIQ